MTCEFDKKGHLYPYEAIVCDSLEALEYNFVTCFPVSSSRKRIYLGFLEYLFDMGNHLKNIDYQDSWKIWIDGSFISQKNHPNDLDLLNILADKEVLHQQKFAFEPLFAERAKESYYVDAYFLLLSETQEIKELERYWRKQFGRSQDYSPKGFIEMTIQL
ncbi:MAG: hypothetical protein U0Y10_07035 [Spirosomataceae bacterium]